MVWLDKKYIHISSGYLRNFKQKSSNVYNFSCPLCGDSEVNSRKARGYFYEKSNEFFFYCHNCARSFKFSTFLKQFNPALFKEYIFEKYKSSRKQNKQPVDQITEGNGMKLFQMFSVPSFKKFCQNVAELDSNHIAVKYLVDRKIPYTKLKAFYYCDDFKKFEELIPEYKDRLRSEPRIILPVYDRKDELIAFVCRSLNKKSSLRYINLLIDKKHDKFLFNINNINFNERVFVVEGPIDSLFIENCIAVGTADFSSVQNILVKDQTTLIFDNQPLNRELLKNIYKMANKGWSIVVWPSHIKQKDINDMILDGMTSEEIQTIISENTYSGLKLKLKLAEWTKR